MAHDAPTVAFTVVTTSNCIGPLTASPGPVETKEKQMEWASRTTLAVALFIPGFATPASARTIYVCWDGSGDYLAIQQGIDAAVDGDEVVVCDGRYTGEGNKNLDFSHGLPDGYTRAITVRSENGADKCIIDCENDGRGFVFHTGEHPNSIVGGFTITNAYAPMGAGIYCMSSTSPTLLNCRFIRNHAASNGGGIRIHHVPSEETLEIVNCAFVQNCADSWGGAIANSDSKVKLTNCTFAANTAGYAGGIANTNGSTVTITNSILWGNTGQIWNEGGSNTTVNYSCIEGGHPGYGNIDCDPQFVSPPDDVHLSAGPCCIDAGDNTAVPPDVADLDEDGDTSEPTPLDLDLNPRFVDDPCTHDTGNGDPPIVDMGAYEYFPDCNGNGTPDDWDVDQGVSEDCNANGVPDECDLDPNDPDCDGAVSDDYDQNNVPDECDPDCNNNHVPDACDIDCDTGNCLNHPLGCGQSDDCQANGIPDDCEWTYPFIKLSDELPPFYQGYPQVFEVENAPVAHDDVTLTFWVVADLDQEVEYVSVFVNGEWVCDVFVETGSFCPDEPDTDACTLGASAWNQLVAYGDGDAEITMQPSDEVDNVCQHSYIVVEIAYTADRTDCNDNGLLDECELEGNDCNGNEIPDDCDIADCDPNDPDCQDCNENGNPDFCDIRDCDPNDPNCHDCNENDRPDSCDIDDGTSQDINCNGVPDECECVGDITGDDMTYHEDLGILLALWGKCEGDPNYDPAVDINRDGCVNQPDLGILLGDWGCGM
jgi:hypothetical protein